MNISKRYFTKTFASRIACLITLLFMAVGMNAPVHAQVSLWLNQAGGIYESPSNWSGDAAPGPASEVIFGQPTAYTVEFLNDQTADELTITSASNVEFKVLGLEATDRSYSIAGNASIINASLSLDSLNGAGNLNLTIGGELDLQGELSVLSGGRIDSDTIDVDEGSILIDGVGSDGNPSMITTTGLFAVEQPTQGEVLISGGAILSTPGGAILAADDSSYANVQLIGQDVIGNPSQWDAAALNNGGQITVSDGALLTSTDTNITGTVRVRQPDSIWTVDGVALWGGDEFDGDAFTAIAIDDGGHIFTGTTFIANNLGNTTNIYLDGFTDDPNANSSWTSNGNVYVGGSASVWRGDGQILLSRHSRVEVFGTVKIWNDSRVAMFNNSTFVADTIENTNGGSFNFYSGTLSVNQLEGNLDNLGGILSPGGYSAGSTAIFGTYSHQEGSTLAIDIGGTTQGSTYDVVSSGLALLNGEINVTLIEGFTPDATDEFTVLLASNIVGDLANVLNGQRLQTSDGGGSFVVNYGIGSPFDVSRIVLGDFEPGDFVLGDVNGDGAVDLLDVAPFVDAITTGTFIPAADINQDGSVDLLDVSPFVALLVG